MVNPLNVSYFDWRTDRHSRLDLLNRCRGYREGEKDRKKTMIMIYWDTRTSSLFDPTTDRSEDNQYWHGPSNYVFIAIERLFCMSSRYPVRTCVGGWMSELLIRWALMHHTYQLRGTNTKHSWGKLTPWPLRILRHWPIWVAITLPPAIQYSVYVDNHTQADEKRGHRRVAGGVQVSYCMACVSLIHWLRGTPPPVLSTEH